MNQNKSKPSPNPADEGRQNAKGNGGNTGSSGNFDEQHGARGTQLNANTTGNTGKSKKRGA